MAKKINLDGSSYYSLADSCSVLKKARSTLMRLLPAWEETTKEKPIKDHSGRWLIPSNSVHALKEDPELYLKLAGRSTKWSKWEAEKTTLLLENRNLRRELSKLKKALGIMDTITEEGTR